MRIKSVLRISSAFAVLLLALIVAAGAWRAGKMRKPAPPMLAPAPSVVWDPIQWSEPPPGDTDAFAGDWSPDGRWLLVKLGDYPDRELAVIDTRTWRIGPRRSATTESAAFTSGGEAVLVLPYEALAVASVPELATRRVVHIDRSYLNPRLAVSADATLAALVINEGVHGRAEVWRLDGDAAAPEWRHAAPSGPYTAVTFIGASHDVAVIGADPAATGPLVAWNSRAPSAPFAPLEPVPGPASPGGWWRARFSPDGNTLLLAGVTNERAYLAALRVPTLDLRKLAMIDGRIDRIDSNSDGARAALVWSSDAPVIDKRTSLMAWDTQASRALARYDLSNEETQFVSELHVSPDGKHLLWARRYLKWWATATLP
jgi:hypothetical protein